MNVRKSNGSIEEFDNQKVKDSICHAYDATGEACDELMINSIADNLYLYDNIETSEIRRQVEDALMSVNKKVAKTFRDKYEDTKDIRKKQDFIQNYIKASNAATGSKFDSNANVSNKNVVTLGQELYKENNIKQNRYILCDKIKTLYSKKLADQYLKDLESHVIYKHDESGTPGMPYTYSSKEVVEVLYNSKNLLLPLDMLYDIVDEEETLVDKEKIVYQKHPWNLFIKDRNNQYTKVTTVTKKKRHRDLVRVKTAFGEDIVVTDNHPMIVDANNIENTVSAIDSLGKPQFKIDTKLTFKGKIKIDLTKVEVLNTWFSYGKNWINAHGGLSPMKRYIDANEKLGHAIGIFIGCGNFDNTSHLLYFTQKDRNILETINCYFFDVFNVIGKITYNKETDENTLHINNVFLFELFRNYFKILGKNGDKTLPYNVLEFNEDFALGILGGIVDSAGATLTGEHGYSLRLPSRACIMGCTALFRHFGYSVENEMQYLLSNNKTLWEVCAHLLTYSKPVKLSFKEKATIISKISESNYKTNGEAVISKVQIIENESAFLKLNEYIYDITTETHTFELNNLLVHNCVAITMYPFLKDGLRKLGGQSKAPTDFRSFCGEFINLVYSISSQFMGAVSTPEFFIIADYFLRKDYGDNYDERVDEVVDLSSKRRTLGAVIDNGFQQVVHSMNMPAGNRGYQTVFWNVGYFDKPYFDGVFGDFRFPDNTKPKWETVSWLQKRFMKWFNHERESYMLTFPVETMALLTDGGSDFADKDYADFTAEMWSEGHSFFVYLSDSPDSLSSCCFSGEQKVLWKSSTMGVRLTSLKELYDLKWEPEKNNLRIFHNGSWVKGKAIKLPNRKMYEVETFNNKKFFMTDNHINVTLDGEKETKDLTTNDYLMFNTLPLNAVPENDEKLTYEQGFVIGAFLGDGSLGSTAKNGVIYDISFSQNKDKYEKLMSMVDKANKQLGNGNCSYLCTVYNNVYPVRISSKEMSTFIIKWTNWERGTYAYNKKLNLDCLLQSVEFRKGILDGWYNTDGGNSNRCYTTSSELAEDMEALITSLGMQSIIDISDRTDENIFIREEEYARNYPLYCVRWYENANHRANKCIEKSWIKKNNSIFFKIRSIKEFEYNDDVYCIECGNANEPYFTLPSGLITHNCRLRNSLKDIDLEDKDHNHNTHQYSMGTASVATGSKSVMTINLPRTIQNATRKYFFEKKGITLEKGKSLSELNLEHEYDKAELYEYIRNEVREVTDRVHKYQTAFNEIIKDFYQAGMLTVYNAGFIDLKRQYLTVGVNGITDAAEFLSLSVDVNDEYSEFVNNVLETINIENRKDKTRECMFNTEFVPAENLAVKNYKWDKKDGYWVSPNRNLYSSYFFNPEDASLSVIDKMKLHGKDDVKYLDGGSADHNNLAEHLSKEQYRHLLNVAAANGCNYFTFNVRNTACNDCGYISKHTLTKCPRCGSTNIDYLTRVIGYLVREKSMSEARQEEAERRFYVDSDHAE